jgi:hypothetical protein
MGKHRADNANPETGRPAGTSTSQQTQPHRVTPEPYEPRHAAQETHPLTDRPQP